MTRLSPLDRNLLPPDIGEQVDNAEKLMGFAPNDALIMARHPAMMNAVSALVGAVYGPGKVDAGLKRLIGEATSKAAGCFYCSAHAANGARDQGVDPERIAAVWNFEDSDLFSDAERAAIRVAMHSGLSPNATTDEDFDTLKKHFSDDEITEIVGVIAMFGFLNRWNSTLQTELEPNPAATVADLKLRQE